jgi:arylsulfate sulfotransferase
MLPVFGLYANYLNTVVLTYSFSDGSTQRQTVLVPTVAFSDPCGFNSRTVIQARTSSTELSYDFMLLKNRCGGLAPTIMDTDGEVRWVGTAGAADFPSGFFQNGMYLGLGQSLYRMEFDGASSVVADYPILEFHHNIDPGKRGIIVDEDLPGSLGATNAEVDGQGNVLRTWDLVAIVSNAMIAGGDSPDHFVRPSDDWFHNNAVAYRKSDNSLVISSRENFVICIDYDTGAVKWILGDPTKAWFQYPSLRQYALTLGPDTLPPIGQHAVSITDDDKLLLFDDGQNSLNQTPPGNQRGYSAPRKYDINQKTRVATEVWNYPNAQSLFSPFCSSIYEDLPNNYLIDYSIISNLGSTQFMELIGLSASGARVFDYRYVTSFCDQAWNATPLHLDKMRFTTIVPLRAVSRKTHGAAGTFDLPLPLSGKPGIECRSGGADGQYQVVFTFPTSVTAAGATVIPEPGNHASVSGPPIARGSEVTVNLTDVSNAQTITVNLVGLTDGVTSDTISVPMTVLVGDSATNGSVNASDISKIKTELAHSVTAANYRDDVTANGMINITDVALVESLTGTAIPEDTEPPVR